MDDDRTTNQDSQEVVRDEKGRIISGAANPEGRGGFGDHPESRSDGRWSGENSQKYCLNKFLNMNDSEFKDWGRQNPPEVRTVAQALAYNRIAEAVKDLKSYHEVVNRTEGRAPQTINVMRGLFNSDKLQLEVVGNDDDEDKQETEKDASVVE